jgi:SAM-dependent methyltransferase
MAKLEILDLGPGERPFAAEGNITTMDFNSNFRPTIKHDLNKFPWPLPKDKFDIVHASHVIEHIKDTVRAMEEIYKVAKPGAKIIIRVPHFSSRGAWINPTHYRGFAVDQFQYFSKAVPENYGNCDFKVTRTELRFTRPDVEHGLLARMATKILNSLANMSNSICERTWCYWVGGFSEIYAELEAVKPMRKSNQPNKARDA